MKISKLILTLSAIIAIISLVLLVTTLDTYGVLTGRATDTGTANVTIESTSSIQFTTDTCDFGTGSVDEAPTFAVLDSAAKTVVNGTWNSVSGMDCLVLQNDGNSPVNISLNSDVTAVDFIGGTGPDMEWKVTGTCTGTDLSTYADVSGSDTGVCDNLAKTGTLHVDFELTIPEDAPPGTNDAVIIATGIVA